jgi:hypothetical protein
MSMSNFDFGSSEATLMVVGPTVRDKVHIYNRENEINILVSNLFTVSGAFLLSREDDPFVSSNVSVSKEKI